MTTLIILAAGWWIFRLITRPFKPCRHCHGMGRIARPSGRGRPRPCPRCKGSGLRVRLSARIAGGVGHHVRHALDHETGVAVHDDTNEW